VLRLATVCERPTPTPIPARCGRIAGALQEAARGAAAAAARLPQRMAALEQADRDVSVAAGAVEAAQTAWQAAQQRSATAAAELAALRERLGPHGGTELHARHRTLQSLVAGCQALRRAGELLLDAEAACEQVARECEEQAFAAGFDGAAQARAALRSADQLSAARSAVRGHDDALAAVRAALADPDLDVPIEPLADPDAAQARCWRRSSRPRWRTRSSWACEAGSLMRRRRCSAPSRWMRSPGPCGSRPPP